MVLEEADRQMVTQIFSVETVSPCRDCEGNKITMRLLLVALLDNVSYYDWWTEGKLCMEWMGRRTMVEVTGE